MVSSTYYSSGIWSYLFSPCLPKCPTYHRMDAPTLKEKAKGERRTFPSLQTLGLTSLGGGYYLAKVGRSFTPSLHFILPLFCWSLLEPIFYLMLGYSFLTVAQKKQEILLQTNNPPHFLLSNLIFRMKKNAVGFSLHCHPFNHGLVTMSGLSVSITDLRIWKNSCPHDFWG